MFFSWILLRVIESKMFLLCPKSWSEKIWNCRGSKETGLKKKSQKDSSQLTLRVCFFCFLGNIFRRYFLAVDSIKVCYGLKCLFKLRKANQKVEMLPDIFVKVCILQSILVGGQNLSWKCPISQSTSINIMWKRKHEIHV